MAENITETKEAAEVLPPNIGELSAGEVAPLLKRASSRIDILRPKSEFWKGMRENLDGAAGWIEAKKTQLASNTLRAVAGASLVTTMAAACARAPETPYIPPTRPVATEVVPEAPKWTSGLETGLERQVVDSFLEKYNLDSLSEALDKFSKTEYYGGVGYGGFDKERNYWSAEARFLIIGTARVATEDYPGGQRGDFIQLMYGVNPDFGPAAIFPFVVGVNRDGVWKQATPRIFDAQEGRRDRISLESADDMENWLNNEVVGHAADVSMFLYFKNTGDWNGVVQSYENTGDIPQEVKDVINSLDGGYIREFTENPELVKGSMRRGPGNAVEIMAKPAEVLEQLGPDTNPGLFVGSISYEGAVFR